MASTIRSASTRPPVRVARPSWFRRRVRPTCLEALVHGYSCNNAATHGGRGRRGWRKLPLGVDGSRVIVACALTEPTADDAITGISLVDEVDGHLTRVTADPAYDTLAFYGAAGARGARGVVPPTKTASLSRRGARSGARDRTIRRVKALGRRRWKKASGYHQQARVGECVLPVQVDRRRLVFGHAVHRGNGVRPCSRVTF